MTWSYVLLALRATDNFCDLCKCMKFFKTSSRFEGTCNFEPFMVSSGCPILEAHSHSPWLYVKAFCKALQWSSTALIMKMVPDSQWYDRFITSPLVLNTVTASYMCIFIADTEWNDRSSGNSHNWKLQYLLENSLCYQMHPQTMQNNKWSFETTMAHGCKNSSNTVKKGWVLIPMNLSY
jgi:hypothetical protein